MHFRVFMQIQTRSVQAPVPFIVIMRQAFLPLVLVPAAKSGAMARREFSSFNPPAGAWTPPVSQLPARLALIWPTVWCR